MPYLDIIRLIIVIFLFIMSCFLFFVVLTFFILFERGKNAKNKIILLEKKLDNLVPGSKRYLKVNSKINTYKYLQKEYNQFMGDKYEK